MLPVKSVKCEGEQQPEGNSLKGVCNPLPEGSLHTTNPKQCNKKIEREKIN